MTFLMPFFFLLVDSSFGSAAGSLGLSAAAGAVEPELEEAAAGAGVDDDPLCGAVVPGAAASGVALVVTVGDDEPSAVGLATGAFAAGAGFTVVPGVFVSGDVDPGGAAVVTGVVAGVESGPVLMISTPTFGWDEAPPAAPVLASSGVTTSVPVSAAFPSLAEPAATVNDGPCAPGRRTSVADTTSLGGLSCGVPLWAAVEKSGSPLTIFIGIFNAAI
jgi:hypothetical protein